MEVRRIRRLPRTQRLLRERLWRRDDAEEVHAPGRAPRLVDVEQPQRDNHVGNPRPPVAVQLRRRREAVRGRVEDVEVVKRRAVLAHFARVVHERLVRDVVRADLVLEVGLRVVVAAVDEGLHDGVLEDVVVGAVVRVEVEVLLFKRLEGHVQRVVVVAEVDVRAREVAPVWHRLVEFGRGRPWTSGDAEVIVVVVGGWAGRDDRCRRESAGEKSVEAHLWRT